MCGACEEGHGRRWTSTRLLILAFVATLLVLSVTGVVMRVRAAESGAADPCQAAASAAVRFQSAVTVDMDLPALLRADTAAFVGELRSLGATGCPDTRRFLSSAEKTIGALCPSCASDLRRARDPVA